MNEDYKYNYKLLQASDVVTGSYQTAGTILGPLNPEADPLAVCNQAILLVDITSLGNMTSMEVEVAFSHDGITYYPDVYADNTGGFQVITAAPLRFTATGNYPIPIQVKYNYLRIRYKGTGGDGAGSAIVLGVIFGTA